MPTTLTEAATFDASVPVPNDTEGATGASIAAGDQPLANRSQYLKNITDVVGVKKIREVADLTALAALTGNAVNDKCYVPGYGLYRFETPNLTAASPWIVNPTSGGGSFVHELKALRTGAGATLATVASGKVVEIPPYAVIASAFGEDSAAASTTASSYVDRSGNSYIQLTCATGDLLEIIASGSVGISTTLQEVYTRVGCDDGTAGAVVASARESYFVAGGFVRGEFSHVWRRTIVNAGLRTVSLQFKTGGSGTAYMFNFQIAVKVYRP